MEKLQIRDSNIELLRIISMFMIVVLHMGTFGIQKIIDINTYLSSYNQFIYHFIRSLSIVAVSIYVLISAYFLSNSKVKTSKIIRLFIETSFFCTVIFIISVVFNKTTFDIQTLKESLLAIIFNEYWFVTVFFVLLILSPYINKLIESLDTKEYRKLLVILFFVCCFWEFILNKDIIVIGTNRGYSLIYFIFLYLLGGYIRKFGSLFKVANKNMYLLSYFLVALVNSFIICIQVVNQESISKWYWYNSPLVILMSYFLFQYFKNINLKTYKINFVSKFVFGIYLVHEHPIIREVVWKESGIVSGLLSVNQKWIIPSVILGCVLLFLVFWIVSFIIGVVFNYLYSLIEKWLIKSYES
ncbi:acyltransferase [Paenibacillus illinoisensis]|uniref:acyltransferase n=1 Tax=Paenibacillus illinoisensis TaxID=59845 RepID=UPI003D278971